MYRHNRRHNTNGWLAGVPLEDFLVIRGLLKLVTFESNYQLKEKVRPAATSYGDSESFPRTKIQVDQVENAKKIYSNGTLGCANMFTLKDIGMAYRKAKVDIYYSNDARPLDILEYEENLEENLRNLLERLNGKNQDWISAASYLGEYSLIPKGIDISSEHVPDGGSKSDSLIVASPKIEWERKVVGQDSINPVANFRLISRCSIDLHVISALWIGLVGSKLDSSLEDSAYGNRLRRTQDNKFNWFSAGSFQPYQQPYRQWQDNGLNAMVAGLDAKKPVVAITADAKAFFHQLDASFLIDEDFLAVALKDKLTRDQRKLHEIFVMSLLAWRDYVANNIGHEMCGLPVALPASGVVANLALIELDRIIDAEIKPLYYGRYVDDIILVMEGGEELSTVRNVWKWIAVRSGKKLNISSSNTPTVEYVASYLSQSKILFDNSKNKVFLLEGSTGRVLVESIRQAVQERASEWRALSSFPGEKSAVATSIVDAAQADGDLADSLRKTEKLSASRSGFALKVRDFEAYSRDLNPDSWIGHRTAFFETVRDHVMVPPRFFELAQYFPRVLRLAIGCGDWNDVKSLIDALYDVYEKVRSDCQIVLAGLDGADLPQQRVLEVWGGALKQMLIESLATTVSEPLDSTLRNEIEKKLKLFPGTDAHVWPSKRLYRKLFLSDLAATAFRTLIVPQEFSADRSGPINGSAKWPIQSGSLLFSELTEAIGNLAEEIGKRRPDLKAYGAHSLASATGLLFPTRPLGVSELFALTRVLNDSERFSASTGLDSWLLGTRGFTAKSWVSKPDSHSDGEGPQVKLPYSELEKSDGKVRVAIGAVKTERSSLDSAIQATPDLSLSRYNDLVNVINDVIRLRTDRPHYLVLPELSVPAPWYLRFADKLAASGISLIAGVEYLHPNVGEVRNQVWASLVHEGLGFRTNAIYRQDKMVPAPGEESNLHNQASLRLVPEKDWSRPPIIEHGDFKFSILVCYELTNIEHRAALRGRIDALFVPEWNTDLHTFDALVESSAIDIHAYIVQVNNRTYGDSRIRAPYAKEWERDVVRVRGGMHDHFVVGEINVHGLRLFQSQSRVPGGVYKPLPDGFRDVFDDQRKRTPKRATKL